MRDHQQLSFRVPQELTSARAAKGSPVVIQKHFTELQKIIRDRFLIADKIWNMDKYGVPRLQPIAKSSAQKNARQVQDVAGELERAYLGLPNNLGRWRTCSAASRLQGLQSDWGLLSANMAQSRPSSTLVTCMRIFSTCI